MNANSSRWTAEFEEGLVADDATSPTAVASPCSTSGRAPARSSSAVSAANAEKSRVGAACVDSFVVDRKPLPKSAPSRFDGAMHADAMDVEVASFVVRNAFGTNAGTRFAARNARSMVFRTALWIPCCARNRTSLFAGCTFTSTSCGSTSKSSATVGVRALSSSPRYASRTACKTRRSMIGRPLR